MNGMKWAGFAGFGMYEERFLPEKAGKGEDGVLRKGSEKRGKRAEGEGAKEGRRRERFSPERRGKERAEF